MKYNLNNWLADTANPEEDYHVRAPLVCNDGTTLSVQASRMHYCSPRLSNSPYYSQVEVWQVTAAVPESWLEYGDEDENPYAFIPINLVEDFIESHGGIKRD